MSLRVYTGLPASGKTSALISEMQNSQEQGRHVMLILSSEHEELTRRANVRPGGIMGSRSPGKKYPIDHVVTTGDAGKILDQQKAGSLVVFDEAQFFKPELVASWKRASDRGVDVLISTPSPAQLEALEDVEHDLIEMTVSCRCGATVATRVVYNEDLVYPTHLCERCSEEHIKMEVSQLLEDVKEAEPFSGELRTYQPFYDIDMSGWGLVREDCPQRLRIILDAANRCAEVVRKTNDAVEQPSFIDLGCCSGFFADGMATAGFNSSGVDISADFINWGSRLARIKGQRINYKKQNLHAFLTEADSGYDVVSTFATVQWVMAQQGYDAGLRCFERIFELTGSVCIIEMGYTAEDIYRDKITDRPVEIDRQWVRDLMEASGRFEVIEFHSAGENGIWRDIFVGFVKAPTSGAEYDDLGAANVRQTSSALGHWEDGWVGPSLDVGLQATRKYRKLHIEGWRPKNWQRATVSVAINGDVVARKKVSSGLFTGLFTINANIDVAADANFELTVSTDNSFRPENDARQLCFILRKISFS